MNEGISRHTINTHKVLMVVAQYMFSILIGEILGGLACLSFDFRQVFIDLGQFFA